VAGWDSGGVFGRIAKVALPAGERLTRLAVVVQMEVIGVLLLPQNGSLLGIDSKPQTIFFPGTDLTDDQGTFAAALESKQRIDVFIKPAVGQKCALVCTKFGDWITRDIFEEVDA